MGITVRPRRLPEARAPPIGQVGLLWEYKTGLLSGLLFFAVAFTAASSMVALFVGGMCEWTTHVHLL